jgi:hypothetical protein
MTTPNSHRSTAQAANPFRLAEKLKKEGETRKKIPTYDYQHTTPL